MIIVRVVGGLANQMGGYAAAYSLAQQHGVSLKIDLSGLRNDKLRKLDLDKLAAPVLIATEEEIRGVSHRSRFHMINRLKKSAQKRLGITDRHIYKEKTLGFDPALFNMPADAYIVGDFPSYRYYERVLPSLKKIFQVKAPLSTDTQRWLETINASRNSVALHVRRTDYVSDSRTLAVHGSLGLPYYERASRHVLQHKEDAEFFVFSDDPAWVKENIVTGAPTHYVDCNNAANGYQDFHLMKHCKHYIMANSGFSRWATILSESEMGIVIRPERWTVENHLGDADIGPGTWLKM